jgi:FAD/FMN-containing dehydrogenase
MNRRAFLKAIGSAALLPILPRRLSASTNFRRCRPSDAAWPTQAAWKQLNDAVGGNLISVDFPLSVLKTDPQGDAAKLLEQNIRNPYYIRDQPGLTESLGWVDAWATQPSVYAVVARNAQDIAAAVNFARENNLRLVVKGGGHSYQGTSNAADSLLVWTRAMNAVTLHDSFVGQGCESSAAPTPAVTVEAGAMWIDAYDAVTTKAGRYVQGGGCTTVGVAGLVQSGGFGSMSKGFGTAAAGLLEAEIVTADGALRVVNACSDPDLYWALKGGGGGSWGAITRATLGTHDLPEFFGGARGAIKAQSDEAFRRLIGRFVDFYASDLFNPHWGESVAFGPDNTLRVGMVCQGLDSGQAQAAWRPFYDWVRAAPQDFASVGPSGAGAKPARGWWDVADNNSMIADPRPGAPSWRGWWRVDQDQVGAFLVGYHSLWLPASLLADSQRGRLADALFSASRHKPLELHFNKGLAGAPEDVVAAAKDTATNPAVMTAFALAIIADGVGPRYPGLAVAPPDLAAARQSAEALDLAARDLIAVAPDAGAYVSESDYFQQDWQSAYWGANHARLEAVKAKYDPDGLFFVHNGVGSDQWSRDGFTRL